ncbi:PoNe immunity protein domain-containing protein [Treponema pedis]|uniref:PoNi-like cognate immunity protein n=1 Tax=Treponema pedis TaxID=409322 RepID=UPI003D1C3466
MKVRDNLNTLERYQQIIENKHKYIVEDLQEIAGLLADEKEGLQKYPKPNLEVIQSTKGTILNYYYDIIIGKYSAGYDIAEIKKDFINLLNLISELWQEKDLKEFTYGKNPEPYYGTDEYEQVLTLISWGILFNMDDYNFQKIIKVRDKVATSDILLDFLLSFKDKRNIHKNRVLGNKYLGLIPLIERGNTVNLIPDLQHYLSKTWYKERSYTGWYNSHKSKHNIYTGYWSFESGALVKILGLDDSILKGQKYYPYDMVHWQG